MAGDHLSAPSYYDGGHSASYLPITPPRSPQGVDYVFPTSYPQFNSYSTYPPTPPVAYALPYSPIASTINYDERNGQECNGYAANQNERRYRDEYDRFRYPSSQYVDSYIDCQGKYR